MQLIDAKMNHSYVTKLQKKQVSKSGHRNEEDKYMKKNATDWCQNEYSYVTKLQKKDHTL